MEDTEYTVMEDRKYIVFKRKAWEDFLVAMATPALSPQDGHRLNVLCEVGEVDDAVVIRTQDEFAPPVLDLYAMLIRMMAHHKGAPPEGGMREAADYFHGRAVEAWGRDDRKLPD